MKSLLPSLLLTWLASINAGTSSPAQLVDFPSVASQFSNYGQNSEFAGPEMGTAYNYDLKHEVVVPRLSHRLREDIKTRLGTRGIHLFDRRKHSRGGRRQRGWRPSYYSEPPLRYGGRFSGRLNSHYNPYGRYDELDMYAELPDDLEAFLMQPFSSQLFQTSSELNGSSPPRYYRPQFYNRPTVPDQTSYYQGQFMRPEQVKTEYTRPSYYPGQAPASNWRPSQKRPVESTFPTQPYYFDQISQLNGPSPSPYYYNNRPSAASIPPRPLPTFAAPENRGQPVESAFQKQQARPGYLNDSNSQIPGPNALEPSVSNSAGRVNPSFQKPVQMRPPDGRYNESNIQSLALNAEGLLVPTSAPQVNREQPVQSTFQRPQSRPNNRDQTNVQLQASNALRRPILPDSRAPKPASVSDSNIGDSNVQNVQLQSVPTSEARENRTRSNKLDQDTMSGAREDTPAQSDKHVEVQSLPAAAENQNHKPRSWSSSSASSIRSEPEEVVINNGQPQLTARPAPPERSEEPQPLKAGEKTNE